ncbi:S24/S26 family peptidase [Desulfosporosinus meridiei]|uniref:Putative transcriptional regulator n=1 Tax=Desulfosporosinus meridiei (strain ATCC BAA-275 / DSM 13257 / KCTC 12902 / NCIMB 13706 / S10) TaxID=768704 RepID=J7J3W6_DESMD|nr:S24/S26 family peptidase [Desulfosporosinus meridiei]AFQ45963.1 putative transcriptional regulator [Desulfosporosinus meridiei DSM 13257]
MFPIKTIKAAGMLPLISGILELGQNARITVSGNSMYPFLREGIDSVELTKGSFEKLSKGDIAIVHRTDGHYVMHRIIRKDKNCFFMVGDAQQWIEGPLYPYQVVAMVTAIWRKDNRIACQDFRWIVLSRVWLYLRPFRGFILRFQRKLIQG